jgi:enamine deaminase RidA (YjgF/YER057c/UK114 family)
MPLTAWFAAMTPHNLPASASGCFPFIAAVVGFRRLSNRPSSDSPRNHRGHHMPVFTLAAARLGGPGAVAAMALYAMLGAASAASAQNVVRLPLQGSDFPISAAVTVHSGSTMYYLSGALPPVVDKTAPKGSAAAFGGDTAAQTKGALGAIKATLARLGLGMGDVIKMTVFLAGDPAKGGKMDFAGLMAGYTQYFGTPEQPNKPARSAVQVAALAAPGALVEIEVIAAK